MWAHFVEDSLEIFKQLVEFAYVGFWKSMDEVFWCYFGRRLWFSYRGVQGYSFRRSYV